MAVSSLLFLSSSWPSADGGSICEAGLNACRPQRRRSALLGSGAWSNAIFTVRLLRELAERGLKEQQEEASISAAHIIGQMALRALMAPALSSNIPCCELAPVMIMRA